MDYEKYLNDKLLKRQKPDFPQIAHQLERSLKDLKTAEANLEIDLLQRAQYSLHAVTDTVYFLIA